MDQVTTRTAGDVLPEHLYFERLLTEVSASFVNMAGDRVDAAINDAMRRIVEALGLDRSALFQVDEDTGDHVLTHQASLVPVVWPPVVSTKRDYPWTYARLSRGEPAAFSSIDDLPDETERAAARARGSRSRIALPLTIGGKLAGYIGFATVREERQWTDEIVGRLQLVAQVFAGALARQRADAALESSEARFRSLADDAPTMIWMSGPDRRATFLNRRWLEFVGHTLEHELGDGWVQGIHPEDLDVLVTNYVTAFDRRVPFTNEFRLRRCDGAWRWIFAFGAPNFDRNGVFGGYVGTCTDISERKLAEQAIRDLTGRLITAQEAERARIARELHDDISQQIAGLAIALSGLKRCADAQASPRLQQDLSALQRQIAAVTDSIWHLSHDLHPTVLDHGGLDPALRGHCADFARQHQIRVDFDADDDLRLDDRASALCLFRVAQEALHNVAKHAGAETVQVTLRKAADEIILTITDDGAGFDQAAARENRASLGLRSIDERVRLAQGRLIIETAHGIGTTVSVVLPLQGHQVHQD